MTQRKHSKLIKLWADGARIELYINDTTWVEVTDNPAWNDLATYRVKPDLIEAMGLIELVPGFCNFRQPIHDEISNIKLKFDPITKKLVESIVL